MSVLSVRCIMCAGMYVRMQLVGNASMSGYVREGLRPIVFLGEGQWSSGAKRGLRTKPEEDTRLHEVTVPSQGMKRVTCPPLAGTCIPYLYCVN